MLCLYSSCSKDSFDSLRLEHWKSFSVYHWEVGLFGWGLFWGYCYLQRLQAKSMLWLFFVLFCEAAVIGVAVILFSVGMLLLLWSAIVPKLRCGTCGDNAIFRWMQCQSDIRMNARTPGFTLLPVIGFMDIRCGRFLLWNGMEVPFRLNTTLQYLQTEQITFTLIVVCAIRSS